MGRGRVIGVGRGLAGVNPGGCCVSDGGGVGKTLLGS